MDKKIFNSLHKIGLNTYESKAYIALNSLITAKANEISEFANVPRTKIYESLNSLNKKGFLEVKKGRPAIYTVISPKESFKIEKDKLINELQEVEDELNYLYENKISQVQAPMWLLYGTEKIIKKELEIIKRTKKSLNMRIGFLFKNELEFLIKTFKKLPRHVEINIFASSYYSIHNNKIDIIDSINNAKLDNLKILKRDIPFVKMLIRDGEEMFHIYSKFSKDKVVIPKTSIGVWNQYKDICKNYDERFLNQFKKNKK